MLISQPLASQLDPLRPLFHDVMRRLPDDEMAWLDLWDVPLLRALAHMGIDPKFNKHPLPTDLASQYSFSLHLQIVEHLASLSASAMMALPGASLSCHAVQSVGTDSQKDFFFAPFQSGGPVQTFFAVTEPDVGSDVMHASCTITDNADGTRRMNGQKTLIGGAKGAQVGLVFAQAADAPFGEVVMCDADMMSRFATTQSLNLVGLEGAGLCQLAITDMPAPRHLILGNGGSRLRGGLNALTRVFERHRPMVAAMALGTARALMAGMAQADVTPCQRLMQRFDVLYTQLVTIGTAYDAKTPTMAQASALKFSAVRLLRDIAVDFPKPLLVRNPALNAIYRSAKAFEYMEGTSNIHLLNARPHFTPKLGAQHAH